MAIANNLKKVAVKAELALLTEQRIFFKTPIVCICTNSIIGNTNYYITLKS